MAISSGFYIFVGLYKVQIQSRSQRMCISANPALSGVVEMMFNGLVSLTHEAQRVCRHTPFRIFTVKSLLCAVF